MLQSYKGCRNENVFSDIFRFIYFNLLLLTFYKMTKNTFLVAGGILGVAAVIKSSFDDIKGKKSAVKIASF